MCAMLYACMGICDDIYENFIISLGVFYNDIEHVSCIMYVNYIIYLDVWETDERSIINIMILLYFCMLSERGMSIYFSNNIFTSAFFT